MSAERAKRPIGDQLKGFVQGALNDPNIPHPAIVIGDKKTSLYTTPLGRGLTQLFAGTYFLAGELTQITRENLAKAVGFFPVTDPLTAAALENDMAIRIYAPVTLDINKHPGTLQRMKATIAGAAPTAPGISAIFTRQAKPANGKRHPFPVTSPMLSGRSSDISQGRHKLPNQRLAPIARKTALQRAYETIHGNASLAEVTIKPQGAEFADLILQKGNGGLIKTIAEKLGFKPDNSIITTNDFTLESGVLTPAAEIQFVLNFQHPSSGKMVHIKQKFPLGYMPLEFDDDGRITKNPYSIGNNSFHANNLGLTDWLGAMYQVLYEQTGQSAGVTPQEIMAIILEATNRSKGVNLLLSPHLERMKTVDQLSKMIFQYPAETALGIFNTIAFTDKNGQNHLNAIDIYTEITERITSIGENPSDVSKNTRMNNWALLLRGISEIVKKHSTAENPVLAAWKGEQAIISGTIAHLSSSEINDLYSKLTESTTESSESAISQPMPVSALLGSISLPINLVAAVARQILVREAVATAKRETHRREIMVARALNKMQTDTTEKLGTGLDKMTTKYLESLTKLPQRLANIGREAGDIYVNRIAPESSAPTEEK